MKKIKLISLIILVLMLGSFVLVGCSNGNVKATVDTAITNGTITAELVTEKVKPFGEKKVVKVTVAPDEGYRLALGGLTYTSKKYGTNYVQGTSFDMLADDVIVSAKFEKIPVIPVGQDYLVQDGKIYFGEYPQTVKADNVTVGTAANDKGYFTGSDGAQYQKMTATAFNENIRFTNGAKVENETYFKVEPIAWIIIQDSESSYTLMAENIIDNQAFLNKDNVVKKGISDYYNKKVEGNKTYASDYKNSDIREFLNETFMNTAFSNSQIDKLLATQLDNKMTVFRTPAEIDNETVNKYAEQQENTNDKIYNLSYADLFDTSLGFKDIKSFHAGEVDPLKLSFTTDFVRANNGFVDTKNTKYSGMGYWWTRSSGKDSGFVTDINSRGVVSAGGINIYNSSVGVRPILVLAK